MGRSSQDLPINTGSAKTVIVGGRFLTLIPTLAPEALPAALIDPLRRALVDERSNRRPAPAREDKHAPEDGSAANFSLHNRAKNRSLFPIYGFHRDQHFHPRGELEQNTCNHSLGTYLRTTSKSRRSLCRACSLT